VRKFVRFAILFYSFLCMSNVAFGEDRIERIGGAKGSKELVYRGDALVEERSYDLRGALLEEKSFGPDSLQIETKAYIRVEGRLARVEARDSSGVVIGSMAYHYDRNGRLLGLSAEGSLGSGSIGMISSDDGPQGSWVNGADTTVLAYDEEGRAVVIQIIKEGKAISVEKRKYGAGGMLASIDIKDASSGSSTELLYDDKGRQSQRRETLKNKLEIKTAYRYDEKGRLAEEERNQGSHRLLMTRSYADDGSLERVETKQDGQLVLTEKYTENGRIEELYDGGFLFVRATFAGERKIRDEFFDEGVLIRSRDYE
jgi:YD repeat-containing protein